MGNIYIQYEYWFAAIQLILAMLGMGATLTIDDFKGVLRAPRAFSFGTAMQIALVPLIAFVFIKAAGLPDGVAIGIALIAAIPGGTTSNIFTYMAKGSVPLSIAMTGVTTLACLVTTPLILNLLIADVLPSDFTMPSGQIIHEIALTLLLPLFLGMALLQLFPVHAPWISKASIRLSLIFILLIVIGSSSAGRLDLDAFGGANVGMVALFVALLGTLSLATTKLLQLNTPDGTAIQMEVMVRNVNLGVLIKASLFPVVAGSTATMGDTMLFTILLYGAIQMLLAALIIVIRRRSASA